MTMYAENSAGTRSRVNCWLLTYDTTLPTGRITPDFSTTSNPTIIKASALAHDDSPIEEVFIGAGFGKGSYGDQIAKWRAATLVERTPASSGRNTFKGFFQSFLQ